jgi:hypothetical protein
MGLVTKPHTFTASTTALSSQVNANFDTLYTLVNGNIEAANIASGAVGEAELAASAVTNAKVSASAAIALSKLAALTATIVPITDASGVLSSSAVTPTELGYVSGVTSAIQTQINNHTGNTANPHTVKAAQLGDFYSGHVSSTGTGTGLPAGWSVSRLGTGVYEVTHNLGLAATADLAIALALRGSSSQFIYVGNETANTFRVNTRAINGVDVVDEPWSFLAV